VLITVNDENADILRKKSKECLYYDGWRCALVGGGDNIKLDDIINEMYREAPKGLGIAAPQVGALARIIIFKYREMDFIVFNPEIKHKKGAQKVIEGCLSIPGKQFLVTRPTNLILYGQDIDLQDVKIRANGDLASVICHEVDHLDGKLIDKTGKEIGGVNV
jgi:peptide deformylase